ncbi:MAG: hypothetical protein H6626_07415 [Pseudobdellovibrionaceae bacterium]|nr:hypothetical protein [Bdellovibrionales bacterium]USN46058.1 MAG: hypothetical protein H6626_07415 [Pseudobdellovibrionaceae bacterium]
MATTACQLADNKINGSIKVSSEPPSPNPPAPTGPPALSLALSEFSLSETTSVRNTPVDITISTRDQYGDLFYDPLATVTVSTSGSDAQAWLTQVVDNLDGTYSLKFFSEVAAITETISVTVNGSSISAASNQISVNEPRLSFTGDSLPSATVAARTVDETMSPAWTLTGECDVGLGDVLITSPTASEQTVSCDTAGGGTFSATYNYSTTSPYLSFDTKILTVHFYISQSSLQPKRTWIYKTQLASPPIIINDLAGLQVMATSDASKFYILGSDITAVGTNNWTSIGDPGGVSFTGAFDGNGHTIDGLNRQNASYPSLFAFLEGSVSNLKMTNIDLRGAFEAGAIASIVNDPQIHHISVSGHVQSNGYPAGGITGLGSHGHISYVSFSGSVIGVTAAGGVSGTGSGNISFAITSGTVDGDRFAAGIKKSTSGTIEKSTSSSVITSTDAGTATDYGSSGMSNRMTVRNSYFTGAVTGDDHVAGLVSHDWGKAYLSYSLASNITATGAALEVGPVAAKPLIVAPLSTYFSDTVVCTPACTNTDGNQKTMAELMQRSTYTNWDFFKVWRMNNGSETPQLRWMDHLSEYLP